MTSTRAKIYVMRADDGSIKLGHSVNPERRSRQIGRPVEIIHETDVLEQAGRIERLAHRVLALHGSHIRGEWFEASLEQAIIAIEIATRQAEASELALGGKLKDHRHPKPARRPRLVTIWLPDEILEAIDAVIDDRDGQTDRAAVIREAISKGLKQM